MAIVEFSSMGKKASLGVRSKITISVPPNLKRQMDRVKEDVNWSALACAAFERKLAEIASRKEVSDMDDVINRLRVSKYEDNSEMFDCAFGVGEEWAKNRAAFVELERLERFKAQAGRDWERLFERGAGGAYGPDELLYFAIHPEDAGNCPFSNVFWEQLPGEWNRSEGEFVRGFAEGALKVWSSVKHQL